MLGVRSIQSNFAEQDIGENRHIANLLATARKKENVLGQKSQLAVSGKSAVKSSVSFKTPYGAGKSENNLKQAQTTLKRPILQTRILGDKTPLPNRQLLANLTPLPRSASKNASTAKTPLPSLLDVVKGSTPPPPSTGRRKSRTPTSGGGGVRELYKTPITKGDYWNVSDGDIDFGLLREVVEEEEDIEAEDFSEVEYMPPTAVVLPYEPPFEMPNYKELGERLFKAAHSYPVTNSPKYDEEFDAEEILKGSGWSPEGGSGLQLAELEEDDPYLKTLQSIKKVEESITTNLSKVPLKPTTRSTQSNLPIPVSSSTQTSLYSHAKSASVPNPIRKPPSRATSTSTLRPVQPRPATVATTTSRVVTGMAARTRGAMSATASVKSVGTLSTRSSVPNLRAVSRKAANGNGDRDVIAPKTKAKVNGSRLPTAADTRETKASLARAMVRIRHIGGGAAVEVGKAVGAAKLNGKGGVGVNVGKGTRGHGRVRGDDVGVGVGMGEVEEDLFAVNLEELMLEEVEEFRFQI